MTTATRPPTAGEIALANRAEGERLEAWAASFLEKIHKDVRVVGGIHKGSVSDHGGAGVGYDIIADGLYYEVKSCRETIRRGNVKGRRQPGRWKIDAHHHYALDADRAGRTMYLLLVRHGQRVARAYLASHAIITRLLGERRAASRYVTLPHHLTSHKLLQVHGTRARSRWTD